jgi:RluA family pseudouridine synthase
MDIREAVIWSDEAVLAINKPAGLRTIRDGYDPNLPHLAGLLEAAYGRVWTVHRLDKETSGIILFARSGVAHRSLNEQFRQRETQKEYRAIVIGYPEWEKTTIALPLKIDGDRKHRTTIDHQHGKAAETGLAVLRTAEGFALLSAFPHSGYTHQIRAHLAAAGLPLLADPLYRSLQPATTLQQAAEERSHSLPIRRVALHAFQLSFHHPFSGQPITLAAPYPADFAETVALLFPDK